MKQIHTVRLLDSRGRAFGARLDAITGVPSGIDYAHHEIHDGNFYCLHHLEADFDKVDVIGILLTTPNTLNRFHMLAVVYAGSASLFEILEAPTLDAANYPSVFSTPMNRDRNSNNTSTVRSVRAAPVVNEYSVKRPADSSPVTADGTVIHAEMIGSSKQGGGAGARDNNEYILKQNTTYYFRLSGSAGGADNSVGSIVLNYYEHTARE